MAVGQRKPAVSSRMETKRSGCWAGKGFGDEVVSVLRPAARSLVVSFLQPVTKLREDSRRLACHEVAFLLQRIRQLDLVVVHQRLVWHDEERLPHSERGKDASRS